MNILDWFLVKKIKDCDHTPITEIVTVGEGNYTAITMQTSVCSKCDKILLPVILDAQIKDKVK